MISLQRTTAFLFLVVLLPLFAACSEDVADPDPDTYPIVLNPVSVDNLSEIKAFANEGGTLQEITTSNPDILSDPHFAESAIVQSDDGSFRLISATEWQAVGQTDTYDYSRSGNDYVFSTLLPEFKVYAEGTNGSFNVHYIALIAIEDGSIELSYRGSYNPSEDIFDQFEINGADSVAYQTFDIVYEAE